MIYVTQLIDFSEIFNDSI